MEADKILQADVLDIVFQNRNKSYGAYALRRFYSNRLYTSLGIMLGAVALLSAFSLMPEKKKEEVMVARDYTLANVKTGNPKEKKPQEQPKTKTQAAPQQKFVSNIKFEVFKPTDTIRPLDPGVPVGGTTIIAPPGNPPVVGVPEAPGNPEPVPQPQPQPEEPVFNPEIPVENADVQPGFPGGMKELTAFLQRYLQNPRSLEEGESIVVKVKFVVGYDGKLKSFETIQDGGEEFNHEVIRVLKKMPGWIPGKSNGRNVSVYYTLPVRFVAES